MTTVGWLRLLCFANAVGEKKKIWFVLRIPYRDLHRSSQPPVKQHQAACLALCLQSAAKHACGLNCLHAASSSTLSFTAGRSDLSGIDFGCPCSASQWDLLKCQCKKKKEKKRERKKKPTGNIPPVGFWHRPVNKSAIRTQVVPTGLLRNQFSKSPAGLFLMTDEEEFFSSH